MIREPFRARDTAYSGAFALAKPEPWRLTPDVYPFTFSLDTRFQDLDTNAHLNNVAFASMFETGRVRFNRHIGLPLRSDTVRFMVASVEINYLAEGYFPDPVTIASGLGRIGTSSWLIQAAVFQKDICLATCDSVIVMRGPDGAQPISDDVRARIAPFVINISD